MPVVINIAYREYHAHCLPGEKVGEQTGEQIVCPKCSVGSLIFMTWLVSRYLVLESDLVLENHGNENHIVFIRVARCTNPQCKARVRVLPREALPYKVFAMQIIADASETYMTAENGLRQCVLAFPLRLRFCHVTLWYWTKGLGERMRDQILLNKDVHGLALPNLPPVRAILQQTSEACRQPDVMARWLEPISVPEHKYRSKKRHDDLHYVFKFLRLARALFPQANHPVMDWQRLIGPLFRNVPLWMFLTHLPCTSFEHPYPGVPHLVFSTQTADRKCMNEENGYGCRSPPGGVLAL